MKKTILVIGIFLLPVILWAASIDLNVSGGIAPNESVTMTDLTVSDGATVEDLTVNGDTILGSGVEDTFTINNSCMTVNSTYGLNISTSINGTGTSILMIDGANQRIGVNDLTPDAALDVGGSFRIDGSATLGDAITDIITFTGLLQLPSNAAPKTNVTPTAVGQVILNTGSTPDEVCFSTGTTASTWVLLSTPTVSCSN